MTETPYIFDEFLESNQDCCIENIHKKRVVLEPLVFGILRRKYGETFRQQFQTYKRPEKSDRCVLIIERRIHENLEFIIHNVAYYADGWNIAILCSDVNLRYIRDILGDRRSEITVIPVFSGNPERDTARMEYNSLMKSAEFYESLPTAWEHLFIVQMDSYFCRPIPEAVVEYDFFAAPTAWDRTSMGGGMSYRRRKAVIDICRRFVPENGVWSEDTFFCDGSKTLGYKLPPYEICRHFIVESVMETDFFGTHQWWTYWEPRGQFLTFFHALLDCKIKDKH